MAEKRVKSKDLAEYVGISLANLSLLKQGKVRGVRFHTLDRICEYLDCEPGDILYRDRNKQSIERDDELDAA
jgi:putative transcriptional regulator